MIEPLRAILNKHGDAQGWDADSREHVLLQFLGNYEGGPHTAAADLDTFLTDLTAPAAEAQENATRERVYGHLEALQQLVASNDYAPPPGVLDRVEAALLEAQRVAGDYHPDQGPRPEYYVTLSVALDGDRAHIGALPADDEREIRRTLEHTPGTRVDGSGSGMGYREFFAVTTEPQAVTRALSGWLEEGAQLLLRRLEDGRHD